MTQSNDPWWKFKAHHWKTETICDKLLENKTLANLILKGGRPVFASLDWRVIDIVAPSEASRLTMGTDGALIQDGVFTYVGYSCLARWCHPEANVTMPCPKITIDPLVLFGKITDLQTVVTQNRQAAIHAYETLRYLEKSKNNAKRYKENS